MEMDGLDFDMCLEYAKLAEQAERFEDMKEVAIIYYIILELFNVFCCIYKYYPFGLYKFKVTIFILFFYFEGYEEDDRIESRPFHEERRRI